MLILFKQLSYDVLRILFNWLVWEERFNEIEVSAKEQNILPTIFQSLQNSTEPV